LNVLPDTDGEVLDDKVIIIHSSGLTSELEVFQPYSGVRLPGVLSDVSGRSEARREWRFLDAMNEVPRDACSVHHHDRMVDHHAWGATPRASPWAGGPVAVSG
jgi:hypothetical protein